MDIRQLASGIRFAASRAIDRFIVQPRRRRQWDGKTAPFLYTNDRGMSFELHPGQFVDRYIYLHGAYERRFLDLIVDWFSPSAVALDIGSNVGNHAIYLAESFTTIHAFEPNPVTLERLHRNVDLNGLRNIIIHPVGLGKSTETLPFRVHGDGNIGASGYLKEGEDLDSTSHQLLHLQIMNADEFIADLNLDQIDFIKVDVEGWEAPLFEGMAASIARYRPIIAFEFLGQIGMEDDFDRIISAMPGYIIAEAQYAPAQGSLIEKLVWNTMHSGRPTLSRIYEPEPRTYENILAFPDQVSFDRFSDKL